jgi:mRNA interferase RelE/StbE
VVSSPCQVEFRPEAVSDLDRLAPDVRERVLDRVRWLATHFDEITPEALRGRQWRGVLKLRVGDYRILYTADRRPPRLTIHLIGHRREIYR